ncbi:hypothetical protein J2T08_005103 [Neorhizobium galegae]|uniref:hypothetical protein n=1 Tax=Neorhizobium galegae TaxID=399 RepID=UPI001AE92F30|nr:hypothetical protein [Neorhizobium galegae]MBP2562589.1 hypothetical protein [Neorhizobium galegae]MDQ0137164.1 hypothetical protein [Neorhizobium galegae]
MADDPWIPCVLPVLKTMHLLWSDAQQKQRDRGYNVSVCLKPERGSAWSGLCIRPGQAKEAPLKMAPQAMSAFQEYVTFDCKTKILNAH